MFLRFSPTQRKSLHRQRIEDFFYVLTCIRLTTMLHFAYSTENESPTDL